MASAPRRLRLGVAASRQSATIFIGGELQRSPKLPRRIGSLRGLLSVALLVVTLQSAFATESESVRAAIRDLSLTHGAGYPSDAFLRSLDRLEKLAQQVGDPDERRAQQERFALQAREALLANPLVSGQPILFVVRQQYRRDHHNTATFFPAAKGEYNDGQFTPGGALKVIDFAQGGAVRTIIDAPQGVIRDPEVHFDGRRIVFSMRTNAADSYHIYEIHADGTGLRQLTRARDVDDIDPLYLPDGSIAFSSTREPKYCGCNRHIMANLFRMEADGANIHQIGKSTLFEGHGSLMPDGRILYDRWEYVDRNFGDAQALWTVNPDGTSHSVYWGNNTASPGAVLDGRIIPGTDRVLCIFSSCHDRPWGALAIVDRQLGVDGRSPVIRTWPADATNLIQQSGWEIFDRFAGVKLKYEDPFPLSDKYFLCSRMTGKGEQMGLYLVDVFGNETLLHTDGAGCFDPMPLTPRARPPVIPSRRGFEEKEGFFYVQDVYQGTQLQGVKRGAAKWLRVVEVPEKRFWTRPGWNGQGQEAPAMNWHDFNNKRILGMVPVRADGSAYFAVPAERFVYFQLLDENRMMIQSMRSGTMVQPGEVTACVGCHEDRRSAPPPPVARLYHPGEPDRLDGWFGPARDFNYLAEVQPVFDKHCVRCHDFGTEGAKKLILAPDRDLVFNTSYTELWRKKLVKVVGAGPPEIQPAYSWGSHASRLGQALLTRYRDQLSREEFERIVTWVDLNAPYYPSYTSAFPDNLAGRSPLNDAQLARLEKLTGVPLRQLAAHNSNRGPQISFQRPEISPCIAPLGGPTNAAFAEAVAIIREGQKRLTETPDADQARFAACAADRWREEKYQSRRTAEERSREAIRREVKRYDVGE